MILMRNVQVDERDEMDFETSSKKTLGVERVTESILQCLQIDD